MYVGVAACMAFAALWVVTGRWGFGYAETRVGRNFRQVMLVTGAVRVTWGTAPNEAAQFGWRAEATWTWEGPYPWQWRWFPRWYVRPGIFDLIVPLWFPLGVVALLTFWLWSIEGRASASECHCGYDLSGIPPGAPCPECGAVRSSAPIGSRPAPPQD